MSGFDYAVLDLETTTRQEDKAFFAADPHFELNEIVEIGILRACGGIDDDSGIETVRTIEAASPFTAAQTVLISSLHDILDNKAILVGHNIKFDLLYAMQYAPHTVINKILAEGAIWDTMFVEYLLSGQSKKFPSLDYCAERYGGTLKDDKVKAYWDDGVPTEKIPPKILNEYLKHDLINTRLVYLAQRKLVEDLGMTKFVMAQMEALIATTLMEYYGMHFDKNLAATIAKDLTADIEDTKNGLQTILHRFFKGEKELWNPASPAQIACALNGGSYFVEVREPKLDKDGNQLFWKTGARAGEPRMRTVKRRIYIKTPPWYADYFRWSGCSTKPGTSLSTGEDIIKNLEEFFLSDSRYIDWVKFTHQLLKFRRINKELNTYFVGYTKVCRPNGTIHPSYQHVSTSTGRLSCTSPNLQNVTKS